MFANAKRKLIIGALKSDYAKRTYDFIPTWLISYILRLIVDFMLYYRLRLPVTENYLYYPLNMLIAVVVSAGITMCSPIFYDLVLQYEKHIQKFVNHVSDRMTWNFYYTWQTRIVVALSLILIVVLCFVQISSMWAIECIIHTLICGFILSIYDEWKLTIMKPQAVYYEEVDVSVKSSKYVIVATRKESYFKKDYIDSTSMVIYDYKQPSRAKKVNIDEMRADTINVNTLNVDKMLVNNLNVKNSLKVNTTQVLKIRNLQINLIMDYEGKK